MNVRTVPCTPDNNPAMSHLRTVRAWSFTLSSIRLPLRRYWVHRLIDWRMARGNRRSCYVHVVVGRHGTICFIARIETVLLHQCSYHFPIAWRKNSDTFRKRSFPAFCDNELLLLPRIWGCVHLFSVLSCKKFLSKKIALLLPLSFNGKRSFKRTQYH